MVNAMVSILDGNSQVGAHIGAISAIDLFKSFDKLENK